ncbi:MAG: TonB-dependent receptor [Bacteroidota bacterium]
MKKHLFWAISLCALSFGMAQETAKVEQLDSVFIDTKAPLARKNSGKVVVRITSEALQKSAGKSVAEIINQVSGIEINGSRSNDGQNLGYFVRGGRNRQVVVMVDGVQLNDPSSISNDFDLRLLSASSLESIEIVKGASSVLYGSGAATAVISLTTKETARKPFSASVTSTIGTNGAANSETNDLNAITNTVQLSGTANKFLYNASFGHRSTKGLSAISEVEGETPFESDDFNGYNVKADLGYKFNENITLTRFVTLDNFKAEFDDFSYTDADYLTDSEQFRTGGRLEWKYNKGSFVLNDSHSWLDREITSSFPAMFDAQSSTFDAYGSYQIHSNFTVLAGVNANFSRFNSFSIPFGSSEFMQDVDEETAKFDIIDPYVNLTYISDFGLNVNAGARLNNHSNYGTHVVYNVNPSYGFDLAGGNLKALASYSTAYITPSLFQLHDPFFGNLELQPEENTTLEGGLEFTKGKDFRISAVYFNRDETNFVDFVTVDPVNFVFQYQNISDEFNASGVEVEIFKKFGNLSAAANYTNTQADERFALRIPEHKANVRLGYDLKENTYFGLSYNYTSERQDVFFNPTTFESEMVTLESFGLLNLDVSHQINDTIKVFANLSNILDEEYEELFRFQTRGRNFRLGVNLNF